jgi:hypothetical protein
MPKFYYNMIILERITLEEVPEKYRKAVEELLNK